MIEAQDARNVAIAALRALQSERDPLLRPWGELAVGGPVLVHDVAGPPSYWLVPLVAHNRAIGFVRIGGKGQIMAIGVFRRTMSEIAGCPTVVTGISAEEAAELARAKGGLGLDEVAAPPRFVHDGPPGREVWLVETSRGGRRYRWLFVSSGGLYERPAGLRIGEEPGLE